MFPSKTAVISGGASTGDVFSNNYAVDFNGSSNFLDTLQTFQSTIRAGSFSVSMWIKPDDGVPGSDQTLFGGRDNTGDDSVFNIYHASGMFAGRLLVQFVVEGTETNYLSGDVLFSDGAVSDWAFLTVVMDDANDQIYLYKDDGGSIGYFVMDGDLSTVFFRDFTSTQKMFFGAMNNNGSTDQYYEGKMDEMAIWNTALSSSDVSTIYNSGTPSDLNTAISGTKPVAWYRLEEGSGTTATDSSDNATNGTLSHDIYTTDYAK